MAQAEGRWKQGDYLGAIQDYRRIIEEHPKSAVADDAYYWIGTLESLYLHDDVHAVLTYQKLIHDYPASPHRLSAQQAMAEIYDYKLHDLRRAITEYQKLIEKDSDPKLREKIQYRIGEAYMDLNDLDQARTEWDLLVKQAPQSSWADNALYRIGNTHLLQAQYQLALTVYQDLLVRYPGTDMRTETQFGIAQCLEETERLKEALAKYRELETDYSNPQIIQLKIRNLERRLKSGPDGPGRSEPASSPQSPFMS